MKKNCQILTVTQIANNVSWDVSEKSGRKITYKGDSCYLEKDGTFHFVYMGDNGTFSEEKTFTPNEIAYIVDMPLWEVVCVDGGGFDELAILFYEEN